MSKCALEYCEECGRKKDLPLAMFRELQSLRQEMDSFRAQIKELLEIAGYRKKNINESLTDSLMAPSPLTYFVKKKASEELKCLKS